MDRIKDGNDGLTGHTSRPRMRSRDDSRKGRLRAFERAHGPRAQATHRSMAAAIKLAAANLRRIGLLKRVVNGIVRCRLVMLCQSRASRKALQCMALVGWSPILLLLWCSSWCSFRHYSSNSRLLFDSRGASTGSTAWICIDLVEAPFCVTCEPHTDGNYISTRRS